MFEAINLKLTTITPIHIGSGSLFEDYRFIIDNKQLKYFSEMSIAQLINDNPDKVDVFSENIQSSIKHLIRNHKAKLTPEFSIDSGSVTDTKDIKRNIWDHLTNKAYIPGTSLKGAIRTALDSPKVAEISATDNPFKWLKISDCFSVQDHISQIGYFLGYKETKEINTRGKGQFETWSYDTPSRNRINSLDFIRSGIEFNLAVSIHKKFAEQVRGINNFANLCEKINQYYLPKFAEMVHRLSIATLNRNKLINDKYTQYYQHILDKIQSSPTQYCVIHIGWHSEQLHHLFSELNKQDISRPDKNKHGHYAKDRSVVQWLASAKYTNANSKPDDLQPIGWIILSVDSLTDVIGTTNNTTNQAQQRIDGQLSAENIAKFTQDGSFEKLNKLLNLAKVNNLVFTVEAKNHYLFKPIEGLIVELFTRKIISDSWRKKIITFNSLQDLEYVQQLLTTKA
ncbi:MAG: type III-A/MTUBE-associated protein Csm5 [Pseudomonadota bacterium]|jgi:CRISPR/Cas system CSM-associated protein Csm5 (group 7 of RAMP superfamily)